MTDVAAYAGYETWKGWDEEHFMQLSSPERAYFDLELRGIALAGENVLEVGFGNGSFLAWAKDAGATLYGTELLEQSVAFAAKRGITVLPTDLAGSAQTYAGKFGLIAAFDVLEHLSYDAIATLLGQIGQMLRPGGYCVARFPNGQSPLGGIYQAADFTHISVLSGSAITQLTRGTPLRVIRAESTAVPAAGVAKKMQAVARKAYEAMLCRLYGFRAPLGPNLTVLLQKEEGAA